MNSNRRDFLRGVAVLPVATMPPPPRRQLVLRLNLQESPRIRPDRLIISFDLWRCCVKGVGGESALGLVGNLLPTAAAQRISDWFNRQAAFEGFTDIEIPPFLLFQDMGCWIPLNRIAEFFSQGECEIVPFAGDEHERRTQ